MNQRTDDNMANDNKVLVIYHASCWDGFCSAWLLWCVFGDDADYVSAHYGDTPPDVCRKHVFIVDFSYSRDALLAMHEQAASLVVLDHHKSAAAELEGLDFCTFDMTKSGARLTWEHLHETLKLQFPENLTKEAAPWIVMYVEDRDLWKWEMPASKEINAALRSYRLNFELWQELYDRGHFDFVGEGIAILRAQAALRDSHIKHAVEVTIGGYHVLCCNSTAYTVNSEVAGELGKNRPFGAVYFDSPKGRVYSLRRRTGNVDVSEVAKLYGGGGHEAAAGFTLPKGSRLCFASPGVAVQSTQMDSLPDTRNQAKDRDS